MYKRIYDIRKRENEALNNYWQKQSELRDPEFLLQLAEAQNKERQDPRQRVMYIWELAKFRMKKLIPNELDFEEKKKRLLGSEAWRCAINQKNKHLAPEELTEDNIQKEIENVAIHWGMQIEHSFEKMEWIPIAMNSGICRVYIPQ